MMMTAATVQLAGSLQALIDARLDTIDRMLLGRVPRQDRLAIVKDVETQIHELLQGCESEEIGRDEVLAVLARLDPPEAYLPEEEAVIGPAATRPPAPPRASRSAQDVDPRIARASGIVGLSALGLVLFFPLLFLLAGSIDSDVLALTLLFGATGLTFVGGLLGLILGIHSRRGGIWAVVGLVAGALALLLSCAAGLFLVFEVAL